MVDQTKYLCNPNIFLVFSFEQILLKQLRLNEQVIISKVKEIPPKMPDQNISVFPKM